MEHTFHEREELESETSDLDMEVEGKNEGLG